MSRPKQANPTLGELTGGHEKISMTNLHEVLGEKMPDMPYNRVGRLRLMTALQERFGMGYKNIPGVMDTLSDFDKEMNFRSVLEQNKEGKNG